MATDAVARCPERARIREAGGERREGRPVPFQPRPDDDALSSAGQQPGPGLLPLVEVGQGQVTEAEHPLQLIAWPGQQYGLCRAKTGVSR